MPARRGVPTSGPFSTDGGPPPVPVMSITFACESCGKSFTIDDKFAGKKGKCKQCGEVMDIPSRRPPDPARAKPSKVDVYGFEDDEGSSRYSRSDPASVEDTPPLAPRSNAKSAGIYAPPARKRKDVSGGAGVFKSIGRIGLGVVLALVGLGVVGTALRALQTSLIPGLTSKREIEAILQERVALNQQLATILNGVVDVEAARVKSPQAIEKVRGIASNLRELKTTKGLQVDLDTLRRQYQIPQEQATREVVEQARRIAMIPDAWQALNIQGALDELAREERSIPGLVTPESSPPHIRNVSSPPPDFNAAPAPDPGNAPRPGGRRQRSRPGPGGPG